MQKTMQSKWNVLLVLLAVLFISCGVEKRVLEKAQDLTEELTTAAIDFNRMITWRYFDEAAPVIVPESRVSFLTTVEQINQRVHMEGYKITLVQVSSNPFPRGRGEVEPTPPKPAPEFAPPPPPKDDDGEKPKEEKPKMTKMPKKWYGLVLVRYINLSVVPDRQARSPLIRQYWFWDDETEIWLVDPEIEQLLELGKQPLKSGVPAQNPLDPPPLVPRP